MFYNITTNGNLIRNFVGRCFSHNSGKLLDGEGGPLWICAKLRICGARMDGSASTLFGDWVFANETQ